MKPLAQYFWGALHGPLGEPILHWRGVGWRLSTSYGLRASSTQETILEGLGGVAAGAMLQGSAL